MTTCRACVKRYGCQDAGDRVASIPWKNDDYVEPEGNVPPGKDRQKKGNASLMIKARKETAAQERRRRVMISPEVPAGEGFSRDNFIEIRFRKGVTFARRNSLQDLSSLQWCLRW